MLSILLEQESLDPGTVSSLGKHLENEYHGVMFKVLGKA